MKMTRERDWLITRPHYQISYCGLPKDVTSEQLIFDYTIYYLISGKAEITLEEKMLNVNAHSLLFLQPGRAYKISGIGSAKALCLKIDNEMVRELAEQLDLKWHGQEIFFLHTAISSAPTLEKLALHILNEAEELLPGQILMLDALITQVVVQLLREWLGVRRNTQLELSRVGMVDRRLRRAIEFIHSNYHQELNLAEIADAAFLSEYHFAHLFKRLTGTTPHQYLAAVRIEQARKMIAETDLAIVAISTTVGYASQSHFTKIFRSITGLTPAKYREMLLSRRG